MKKHYFKLLGIMLCALLCSNAFAEKLAYGFHLDDFDELGDKYLCTLNVEANNKFEVSKIQDYTATSPIGGAYAEKHYYLLANNAQRATGLYKVDLNGPTYETVVEQITEGTNNVSPLAIAYDPMTQTMYANTKNALYTLNLKDGKASKVADLTVEFYAIAFSAEGELYGCNTTGKLFSINKGNGSPEEIMGMYNDIPLKKTCTSLFFDYDNNKLYLYCTDAEEWTCYLIDVNYTEKTTSKKQSKWGDQLIGLSFIQELQIEPEEPLGTRAAYGLRYSASGTSFVSFNAENVEEGTTEVATYSLSGTPQAGVYAKGAYYFVGKGEDSKYHLFKTNDITTGNHEQVGNTPIELLVKDMAYDPYLDDIYAIADSTRLSTNSNLYKIDLTSGEFVFDHSCDVKCIALAIVSWGQPYYVITETGNFNKYYPISGKSKTLGTIDSGTFGTNFPCDLEFDSSTFKLYWSYQKENPAESYLAEIEPATGRIISQKAYKDNEAIIGLYFPKKAVEPSATWYGYCYANDNILSYEQGKLETFISFDPANLASVSILPTTLDGVCCGTYGENGLYTFGARSNGYGADPTFFSVIDVKTWEQTKLFDIPKDIPLMTDMTYDYSSSMIYAISFEGDPDPNMVGSLINTYTSLYSLSLATKEWKKIGRMEKEFRGIACSLNGELYGMNIDGELCKLNKITGAAEVFMANTNILVEPTLNASLEFDHNNGMLHMTYYSKYPIIDGSRKSNHAYLANIDLDKKEVELKIFPGIDKVCALYIPFERDPNIPAKATDFKVIPGRYGDLSADLEWKNPSLTFGGEALTSITKIDIIRNGEIIQSITDSDKLTPGATVKYTDGNDTSKPTNGFNNYIINISNEAGLGVSCAQLVFIGQDIPAAPKNVTLTVENGTKAILTWIAPTEGANTGWLNPNGLNYDVVRQPDNVKVAEMITLCKFTEDIEVLNYYYYEIIANNPQGTSEASKSNSEVIGTAMEVPYECDFTSDADLGLWTTEGTWKIDYLGLGENVRGLHHGYNGEKADDWTYSPAISLSKDKTYKLQFDARSVMGTGKESMNVFAGTDKTAEAQTIQIIDLPSVGGTPSALETFEANFKVPADGIYYLGFHCYSFEDSKTEKWTYELQVSNVNLDETTETSIDSNAMNNIRIYAADGKVHVEGEYTSATVYDQMGIARSIDATLTSGVYFVKVMNGNATKTYKVLVR